MMFSLAPLRSNPFGDKGLCFPFGDSNRYGRLLLAVLLLIPEGLLLASQTLFKISERYFKGLLLLLYLRCSVATLFKISFRYFKGLLALLR
jgi:hypothetical protein